MFKEFNVEFQDVEMIGGADNLLENTKVTKVVMSGDNKMSSLDSAFKNCSELDNIQGGLDLNGVTDIDNILEGNSLIKNIDLKNINNENISANNSFPNVEEINISGDSYNKKAIQNVIASKEWTFDNITYSGTVGDNIVAKEANVTDDNQITIKDTLEQKAKEIEIKGQTYQNLIEGKGEYNLTDDYSATWTESNSSFEDMPNMIEIPEIWGNTVQGYANVVTEKMIYDSITNSSVATTITLNSDGSLRVSNWNALSSWTPTEDDFNNYSLKLKPNTTYSMYAWRKETGEKLNNLVKVDATGFHNNSSYKYTTDNTGRVFICFSGLVYNHVIRVYEGDIPNIADLYNFDLDYIESVGDLYVDEEGNPILDEEGNEQYKLEIESYSDGNVFLNDNMIKFESNSNWDILKDGVNELTLSQKVRQNYITSTTYILPAGEYTFTYDYTKIQGNGAGCDSFLVYIGDISKSVTSTKTWKFAINRPTPFYFSLRNFSEASATNVSITKYTFNLVRGEYNNYFNINSQSNKTTILLPQQLKGLSDVKDRLFYDYTKNMYVIENKIGDFNNINDLSEAILDMPQIIETKVLEKLLLETYLPKTYISTNTEVEPSQMTITNKKTMLTPSQLQANKEYTLQFECKEKGDNSIKFSLGGAEKEIDATLGVNHINITTLNELSNNDLVLSGQGNKVADVMLIEGDMKQYPNYFDGVQSVGVLQDDNTYKIDIKTSEDFIVSIKTDLPLTKEDRLYWNDTNKRYEIDRNGVIEVPTVEGDVIDLPRLYQRTDTVLTVGTDTIKPSEIKVEYKDLN